MITQNTAPVSGANTAIDLNKVYFLQLEEGKTLREQIAGKKLAGPEVIEHIRSLGCRMKRSDLPKHWPVPKQRGAGRQVYGFSLTYIAPDGHVPGDRVHGIYVYLPEFGEPDCDYWLGSHYRQPPSEANMDQIIGERSLWCAGDWILIIQEDESLK